MPSYMNRLQYRLFCFSFIYRCRCLFSFCGTSGLFSLCACRCPCIMTPQGGRSNGDDRKHFGPWVHTAIPFRLFLQRDPAHQGELDGNLIRVWSGWVELRMLARVGLGWVGLIWVDFDRSQLRWARLFGLVLECLVAWRRGCRKGTPRTKMYYVVSLSKSHRLDRENNHWLHRQL